MAETDIKLNPGLDEAALAKAYRPKQRLQIRDVLEPAAAERTYQCLTGETPWLIGFRNGKKDVLMPEQEFQAQSREKLQALHTQVISQASRDFQFVYYAYPLMDEGLRKQFPDLFLYRVVEFLNSKPVLAFIKKVTGQPKLVRADAQATWYRQQNFLTLHNDYDPSDGGKRVAYVLTFCKDWRPDWGGFLQFYDESGNIEDGFMPRFNALSLFTTPQNHAVSFVTPFCAGQRLAITGWFRDS